MNKFYFFLKILQLNLKFSSYPVLTVYQCTHPLVQPPDRLYKLSMVVSIQSIRDARLHQIYSCEFP